MKVEKEHRQANDKEIQWPDAKDSSDIKILEVYFAFILFL
jgi:hypothetical protein